MNDDEWQLVLHTMKAIEKHLRDIIGLIDSMIRELIVLRKINKDK